jgi:hypothetical protein
MLVCSLTSRIVRAPALLALLLALITPAGCKKKDEDPIAAIQKSLLNVRVGGTPLEMRVPPDWIVADLDPPPPPERPVAADGGTIEPTIKLTGRLMFSARAPKGARGEGDAAPRLEIFHDPWLPIGTTASDYLDAQRADNERAVREGKGGAARIRHVEAERSRREGRPSYHVRDEFTFKVGSERATVSQESLLLIDKLGDDLHGYTVVMTMTGEDLQVLEATRRAVINSVRFAKQ